MARPKPERMFAAASAMSIRRWAMLPGRNPSMPARRVRRGRALSGASLSGSGGYRRQLAGDVRNSRGAGLRSQGAAGPEAVEIVPRGPPMPELANAASAAPRDGALHLRDPCGNRLTLNAGGLRPSSFDPPSHHQKEQAMNRATLESFAPQMLSVLRIVTALIFMAHGTQKLLGFPAAEAVPPTGSLPWIAGLFELIGGGLLAVGLFTRPTAFVLSGLMATAYWMAHAPQSFFPSLNGGDAAILYCFVFLYFVFAGPGPWSLDAARGRTPDARVA